MTTATTAGSMTIEHNERLSVIRHWIGGEFTPGEDKRRADVYNPATGEVAREVVMGTANDVNAAVKAAATAWETWRDVSLARRVRIMFAYRQLVVQHQEALAHAITAEHGKVTSDAMAEVERGLEVVDFACGIPQLLKSEFTENVSTGIDSWSVRQPVGVVAGITPFNFPAMVPMWMFPIAIATGNTFVLKPSERDPSCANIHAELLREAGLPNGVFNIVHGDKEAVDALITHPDVAAVSSVSSTPVARHIHDTAGAHGKRVQSLGGAKNHAIVLPDADIEQAADAIVGAAYGSAGQRCMALSVVVAVGSSADPLRDAVAKRAKAIHVGNGAEAASEMGPVITAASRDKIVNYIAEGESDGATLVVDGRGLSVDGHSDGFFVGPTLIDNVSPDMSVYTDEIFGPVLDIVRVDTYEEAIDLINANQFANGVAIFTNDGGAARRFQHEIEVGMVGINVPIPVPMAYHSFGGWKNSLFGDTHVHGMEGVRFFTRAKVVTARWPDPSERRGVDLGFPQN